MSPPQVRVRAVRVAARGVRSGPGRSAGHRRAAMPGAIVGRGHADRKWFACRVATKLPYSRPLRAAGGMEIAMRRAGTGRASRIDHPAARSAPAARRGRRPGTSGRSTTGAGARRTARHARERRRRRFEPQSAKARLASADARSRDGHRDPCRPRAANRCAVAADAMHALRLRRLPAVCARRSPTASADQPLPARRRRRDRRARRLTGRPAVPLDRGCGTPRTARRGADRRGALHRLHAVHRRVPGRRDRRRREAHARGAARAVHRCELCVPPCPVDCIAMVPAGRAWSARRRARGARNAIAARNAALARDERIARERDGSRRADGHAAKAAAIAAALARARARRARPVPWPDM